MLWSKVFSEKGLDFLSILSKNLFGAGNVKKRWGKLERSLRHLGKSRNKNETLTLKFSEIQKGLIFGSIARRRVSCYLLSLKKSGKIRNSSFFSLMAI